MTYRMRDILRPRQLPSIPTVTARGRLSCDVPGTAEPARPASFPPRVEMPHRTLKQGRGDVLVSHPTTVCARLVTFAWRGFQLSPFQNPNPSLPARDESAVLQCCHHQCDRRRCTPSM